MKKIIPFVAAATLILSFCAPVHANTAVPSVYTTETFDSGEINTVSGTVMRLSPGVGDRGGAVRSFGDVEFSAGDGVFDKGQNFSVSAWIRTKEADKTATFSLCGMNTDGAFSSFDMVSSSAIGAEWSCVTANGVWNGTFSDGTACDPAFPLTLKVSLGENAEFDLDDLRLTPQNIAESGANGTAITEADFETDKGGWSGGSLVSDETAPQGKSYLKIAATQNSWLQLTRNLTFRANHLYKISYWVKADEAYDNNGKAKDTFGVYFLQSARTRVVDTNSFNTDLPGYTQKGFPVNGEWQKIEYYYQFEYKTFTNKEFQAIFRLFPDGMQSTATTGSFGVDDFKIIDMGPVANGDFETTDDTVMKFINKTGEANKSDVVKTKQSVLAWNENDAAVQLVSDARPDSSGKKSMKVTVEADGGCVYQGVGLEKADAFYKISFWAKGTGLTEETPFALVLDRAVPKPGGDMESYVVPDKTYITGYNEQNTDGTFGTWKLTNDWQYFTCSVPNTFPLKEGLTAANADTIPRLPFLHFDVNGNKAGTTYMIDDIEIAEHDGSEPETVGYPYPYLTRVAFAGNTYETGTLQARYTFGSLCGATDNGSHLRMYEVREDGEILIAAATGKSIVIPEGTGGKKIRIEAVPVDSNGRMGTPQSATYSVAPAREVTAEIESWSPVGDITAQVSITSRGSKAAAEPVIVILATYDEENKMVGYETKTVSLSENGSMTESISFCAGENAKTAKLYTWSGTELSSAGDTVYHDTVSYTKGE